MACEKQTVRRMAVGCGRVRHDDGKMGVVQTQRNAGGEVSCAADQNEHDTISPFRRLARVAGQCRRASRAVPSAASA